MVCTSARRFVATLFTLAAALLPSVAHSQNRYQIDLPEQALEVSLRAIARVTGSNVLFEPQLVKGKSGSPVKGKLTVEEAVSQALRGTSLEARRSTDNTLILREKDGDRGVGKASDSSNPSGIPAGSLLGTGGAGSAPQTKITVTAQKRSELLLDVPVPVTAISADSLVASNQVLIQDYYSKIPGLNLTPSVQSAQNLSIRGITTGFANPTVGVTVDDVPYGSSLGVTGGLQPPDIDPSELAHIEVLRGPQGTLYGASSLGGLFKFVTVDPSTAASSGRVQAGFQHVHNGEGLGFSVRGSINMPLSDTVAVRASGFSRRDAGYIENVRTGENGVNSARVEGGRLSMLWRPSDAFSLKLAAMVQRSRGDGASEADKLPGLGDLQQDRLPGTGAYDRDLQTYSAVATASLGRVELTSVTGYSVHEIFDSFDFTYQFGPNNVARFGVPGTPVLNEYETKRFTQEVRAVAPLSQRIEWLVGAFYSEERTRFGQALKAVDPATFQVVGEFLRFNRPYELTESAVFTNVTFQLSDRFDVQLGGRGARMKQSSGPTNNFNSNGVLTISPQLRIEPDDVFTYLVTPRFKISPDTMAYARFASGYRSGSGGTAGPSDPCVQNNFPCQYGPDTTQNYEFGMKGSTPDRKLAFDLSLYWIDWKDIQIQVLHQPSNRTFNTNGSRARSRGIELAVEARPASGTNLAAWIVVSDAKLTEPFPAGPVFGAKGDRLPLSSRFSGNFSFDQRVWLIAGGPVTLGGTVSYIGSRYGLFTPTATRAQYPSYTKLDLRAAWRRGDWSIDFFVNNATDKRAPLSGGPGFLPPFSEIYIQPRTLGMSVTRTF